MILFYNTFVYLKIITTKNRCSGWKSRQAIYHMICLLRGKAFEVSKGVSADLRPNNVSSYRRKRIALCPYVWAGRGGFSGLTLKQAGPIIKGNSFVLAWHLKDRHLVSRQRHLCTYCLPPPPVPLVTRTHTHTRSPTCSKTIRRLTHCFEIIQKAEPLFAEAIANSVLRPWTP